MRGLSGSLVVMLGLSAVLLGCDSNESKDPLFVVQLNWDQAADLDLHVWADPNTQCSQDKCDIPDGEISEDVTNGTGPESFTATRDARDLRYRIGANLHWFEPPTVAGARMPTLSVTIYDEDGATETFNYGPYSLTTAIDDGGYPVMGSTESWWRPIDILVTDGVAAVAAADQTLLYDSPS